MQGVNPILVGDDAKLALHVNRWCEWEVCI